MTSKNKVYVFAMATIIVIAVIAYLSLHKTPPVVNGSNDIQIIRVPTSFGEVVSVSVYSNRVVILFKRGLHIEYLT